MTLDNGLLIGPPCICIRLLAQKCSRGFLATCHSDTNQ